MDHLAVERLMAVEEYAVSLEQQIVLVQVELEAVRLVRKIYALLLRLERDAEKTDDTDTGVVQMKKKAQSRSINTGPLSLQVRHSENHSKLPLYSR